MSGKKVLLSGNNLQGEAAAAKPGPFTNAMNHSADSFLGRVGFEPTMN